MKTKAVITVTLTCVLCAGFWAGLMYAAMHALMAFVLLDTDIGMAAGAARMLAGIVFIVVLFGHLALLKMTQLAGCCASGKKGK